MLQNKIALVSGASRGIGLAIALELGKQGATILGTATTEEGANSITKILQEHHLQGTGLQLNVNQKSSINDLIISIIERYGTPSILINNAAITCDNLVLRMKDEEWENIISTNLSGTYYLTKACLKGMLKARWGRIINISSIVAVTGNAGQVNYAAAKAGLIGLTKSLALEIATRDITVNAVAPGFVDTDMTRKLSEDQRNDLLAKIPAHRFGQPDDIAHAVAFLASPFASYITGQTLHVNGGMYMN